MRVAFVTNFCPHYRIRTFETLSRHHDVRYFFYSPGREWYWQREHGVRGGEFPHEYLTGFSLGRTRVTPSLPLRLLAGGYQVFVKCINGRFALPVTYLVARLRRRPFILWTGVWMRLRTPAHRLFFPVTRHIYRHADAIVVYGEHVKRYLVDEGVRPENIFVAPHAVDNETHAAAVSQETLERLRSRFEISPTARVILYMGRLVEGKGLDHLLEAFAGVRCPAAVLIVVGAGPERDRLERIARERGLAERVRFAGHVAPEDTVPCHALARVLVLPSVTTASFREPWGLVVNEAFNQGVPVIASDAVGAVAGGLVEDGRTGLVVPEADVAALTGALSRLLGDDDLRNRLGSRARERIAGWDDERMVEGFLQAIDHVRRRRVR